MGDVGRLVGGRYRVDRELDRGPGTKSVLVTDLRNGRPCVLRQLFVAAASPADARRFEAQAEILAKLDHPGLPRFIDGFSEGEGDAVVRSVVTSYHPGESLERLVAKGRPLTESQALVLLRRIVPVLVYLHAFDPPLVHSSIKATGIILGPDGRPCLTDLDFAVAGQVTPSPAQVPPGPDELALAAPEVLMGGAVPASDIYALGLALCRGMSAKDPAVLLREGARVQLRGALGVSEAFAAVLARMLEVSLERRYADARALEADLARLAGVRVAAAQPPPARADEEPRHRPGARPLVIAGAALALVALIALAAVRLRNQPAPATSLLVPAAPQEQAAAPSPPAESGPATVPPADPASPSQPPSVPPPPAESPVPAPVPGPEPAAAEAPVPPEPSVAAPQPALPAAAPEAPAAPLDTAPAVAEGRLLFDGKPFANTAAPAPMFWFRKEGAKTEVKPRVDYAAGAFAVRGLPPGRYAMSVRINLEPGNPNIFPGDLTAWVEFTIEAGPPVALEVPLRTVMHLVQPVDNGAVIRGWDVPCGAGNVSPGKVVFSWDALGPGTRYAASVDRLLCGSGYAPAGRVLTLSTAETWVDVDLPPNSPGECYSFRLTASRGGRTVGIMSTHGKTGLGWDHRFRVER
jgi:outer membrane biosynthesis protein TonB